MQDIGVFKTLDRNKIIKQIYYATSYRNDKT